MCRTSARSIWTSRLACIAMSSGYVNPALAISRRMHTPRRRVFMSRLLLIDRHEGPIRFDKLWNAQTWLPEAPVDWRPTRENEIGPLDRRHARIHRAKF